MSRLSPSLLPLIPSANSSSSSLNGMEITAPKPSPRIHRFRKSVAYSGKPLPPTPTLRVPSTTSSVYTEDIPSTPKYVPFIRETTSSPKPVYDPPKYRSSTSVVPGEPPARPKLSREAKTQATLQEPAAVKKGPPESIFSEWKAPKYEDGDDKDKIRVPVPMKALVQKRRETKHIAEQHAAKYKSVLPQASTLPSVEPDQQYQAYRPLATPTSMSPRVTDFVDESLVPGPLRMSTAVDSNASSHFSASSSELMALREEGGESMKSRVKKVFHSRKLSQEKATKKRTDSDTSSKSSNAEKRDRMVSMTPSQRASIQRGIIEMYDTLTSLYDPLNKYSPPTKLNPPARQKPKIEFVPLKRNVTQKEHRSPAIPITPYQKFGRKAWETADSPSPSPRSRSSRGSWVTNSTTGNTPKRSHFSQSSNSSKGSHSSLSPAERKKVSRYSFPRTEQSANKKHSVSGKLKKAVGLNGKKSKKTERDRKREDMKKKIVIVGTVAQGPFG